MQNGLWITRDPRGDRSYAIWSTEPILSEAGDEWVHSCHVLLLGVEVSLVRSMICCLAAASALIA